MIIHTITSNIDALKFIYEMPKDVAFLEIDGKDIYHSLQTKLMIALNKHLPSLENLRLIEIANFSDVRFHDTSSNLVAMKIQKCKSVRFFNTKFDKLTHFGVINTKMSRSMIIHSRSIQYFVYKF